MSTLTEKEQKAAAKAFAAFWKDKGYEKGESQAFWMSLLRDVYGVAHPEQFISFEDQVKLDHTSFIDGYIEATHVMIEQKGLGKDLRKGIKQSDGSVLSPFQQAKRYAAELPYSKRPRWIITCNFAEFLVYDMEKPNGEPEQIFLKDLPKEYYRLQFLVDTGNENLKKEMEISLKAGELVGKLYDSILKQYKNPDDPETLKSLNKLCVRLVFCLYAEDAGIFGKHQMFHHYLKSFQPKDVRKALIELFQVLDTKPEDRDPYMDEELAAFPYVNGGLFADEHIEIPRFTDEIISLLLHNASEDFDWSGISPTIFGAVFESTLNPETRRSGGMHYTSIENIHKVIDPLFLDALKAELNETKELKIEKTRQQKLRDFRKKLSTLVFLDPAAGSGNFLTETYISLRRLENDALYEETHGQMMLGDNDIIQVSISQFYGIEINDFAVTVAKTALWIAESQMMQETETLMQINLDFLPLKSYANIVEGNALRIDWESVVPKDRLSYIMGNPPFVGQYLRSKSQSDDMNCVFQKGDIETKLDYVICWFYKALLFINTAEKGKVKVAFVSTNSLCQGETVPTFWKRMAELGAEIQFAHTTFSWNSEATEKANVHCVIVGFTNATLSSDKTIFDNGTVSYVKHINAYLKAAPDIWITNRTNISKGDHPKITSGSSPTDDGGLLLSPDEKTYFSEKYPTLIPYIRPYIGAREFLHDKGNNHSRFCFWFVGAAPSVFSGISEIRERLERVKAIRENSNADRIRKMAIYPYLFCQSRQPKSNYLVFPSHTSERRKYIPIGFIDSNTIASNACMIVPDISIYEFGVLTSNVHNAWMRIVCGRIKSDYRYNPSVYTNFPWCTPTPDQKAKIEKTAQMVLDARAMYPNDSLADLYDELTMPPELRKAHQLNDRAVMEAYGFWGKLNSESECVAELMKMYQKLTEGA